MKITFALLFKALFAAAALAAHDGHAEKPSMPLEILEVMDDQRIAVFPRIEDVLDAPGWHPGMEPLPLGADEAIELAYRFETDHGRSVAAEVLEVKLTPINDHRAGDRWYYLVKMIDRHQPDQPPHYVAVLMNRITAPAMIDPATVR